MFVVGLTGGIGSGKTAVSDNLSNKGIAIVDADVCSRIVVEPGKPALNQIQSHFGKSVISQNGELDRPALRKLIFSNAQEKSWLENLLHPLIGEEILNQLAEATSPYVILASPLLVESGQYSLCNRILVVDVPVEIQIERTCQRDQNSPEQVQAIIDAQASRQERLKFADDIIENSQGFDFLNTEIEKLHRSYLKLAHQAA